jgi:hypothetical protein
MRIARLPLITTMILGIVIVLAVIAGAEIQAGAQSPEPNIAPQPLQSLNQVQNLNDVSSGGYGIPLTQTGVPAFTSNDVAHYINTHPFPLGPTTTGKPPTIVSIEFITSKEASQRMLGETLGLPDTAIVCYVKLSGPFALSQAPVPASVHLAPSNTATEVFDAQSGNLLIVRTV